MLFWRSDYDNWSLPLIIKNGRLWLGNSTDSSASHYFSGAEEAYQAWLVNKHIMEP